MSGVSVPRIFFLNGELHRKERVVKTQNWIVAWNFPQERRVQYNYSHVVRSYQKAYRTKELPGLLSYSKAKLNSLIEKKFVNKPSGRSYSIGTYHPGPVYWSEDDIVTLRDNLYELEPKINGYPSARFKLVSEAELMQKLRNAPSYYVKNDDGTMVKVWKAFM